MLLVCVLAWCTDFIKIFDGFRYQLFGNFGLALLKRIDRKCRSLIRMPTHLFKISHDKAERIKQPKVQSETSFVISMINCRRSMLPRHKPLLTAGGGIGCAAKSLCFGCGATANSLWLSYRVVPIKSFFSCDGYTYPRE